MTEDDLFGLLGNYDIVVLDEIASESEASAHERETIKEVLDRREGKKTVLISNRAPQEKRFGIPGIDKIYGDAIVSRLCSGTVLHVEGADMRVTDSMAK